MKLEIVTHLRKKEILTTNNEREYASSPLNIARDGHVYHYRLIKSLRTILKQKSFEDKVPNLTIESILNAYVDKVIASKPIEQKSHFPKTFIVMKSERHDYTIGVLVQMREGLIHIIDIKHINEKNGYCKDNLVYSNTRQYYFNDLDVYLDKIWKSTKALNHIKKMKKHPSFYNIGGYMYRHNFTKHLKTKRTNSGNIRLTLPQEAIEHILKYFVQNNRIFLDKHLKGTLTEKKLLIVFPSRDKSYNIGLLVAIDISVPSNMLFTIITMVDIKPKDKTAARYLFPSIERIMLSEYNLDAYMKVYKESQKKVLVDKQKMIEKYSKNATITKVSSFDVYYQKHNIKKATTTKRPGGKIKRLEAYPSRNIEYEEKSSPIPNTKENKSLIYKFLLYLRTLVASYK